MITNEEFAASDFDRMAELYGLLYLRKYSRYNPAFTSTYLGLCHREGIMRFFGLRSSEGVLDGVLGLFSIGGTVTAPIVGYDTGRPSKSGLYRLLMALVLETAAADGLRINLSSGASEFKRLRGGLPVIEYSAVYDRHLAAGRRAGLDLLRIPVNGIGIPLMRALKL